MKFKSCEVNSQLAKFIESIFHYNDFVPLHSIERVVPTGNAFILIELDDLERKTYNNDLAPVGNYKKAWISGMQQNYINISAHQHSEMLVIQFKPYGLYPFLHKPVSQLNNKVVASTKYFGNELIEAREKILRFDEITKKFEIIENWLLEKLRANKTPPQEIIDVVKNIQNQPYSKHYDLLQEYPKTNKNLINQFKKYCGLTPKVLHRVFRFNKILTNIKDKEKVVWSDIAYETGYSDQSHFIKEFQEFSGFNPSKYIENGYNSTMENFFPLN